MITRTAAMVLLGCMTVAQAQAAVDTTWSVTPVFGVQAPRLSGLNNGSFLSDLILTGIITGESENTQPGQEPRYAVRYENDLPVLVSGGQAGAEFYWRMGRANGFIFGIGSWEGSSIAHNQGTLMIQKLFWDVSNEREAKISYTKFYVGWRSKLLSWKRFQLSGAVSLHELFDIDYRDSFVFNIDRLHGDPPAGATIPDLPNNKRLVIMKSQATGGLNLGVGMGAEYFVNDWLSFGFQGNYYKTVDKIFLKDFRVDHDFTQGDGFADQPTDFDGPIRLSPDGPGAPINFAIDEVRGSPLYLDFGGWGAEIRLNFYF